MKQTTRRAGFTSIEVLFAALLIGVALVPMLSTTVETGREAAFSEAYLLAHARAEALVDAAPPPAWQTAPEGAEVELAIPPLAGERPDFPGVDAHEYEERLVLRVLEDGLVALVATVRWSAALPRRRGRDSVAVAVRLIARPEGSWLAGPPARPAVK